VNAINDFNKAAAVKFGTPEPEKELTNVRTVAKEWLAAALALFGLLSFSAFFFGGDALTGFKTPQAGPLVLLSTTVAAVVAALFCNFFGTRAAHGWPHQGKTIVKRFYDTQENGGLTEDADTRRKVEKAIYDLKASMTFAALTVALIVVALGTVVVDQVFASSPALIRAIAKNTGDSLGCGKMSQGNDAATFKLTFTNEDSNKDETTVVSWEAVDRLEAVAKCV
jgi:hypothetical protein